MKEPFCGSKARDGRRGGGSTGSCPGQAPPLSFAPAGRKEAAGPGLEGGGLEVAGAPSSHCCSHEDSTAAAAAAGPGGRSSLHCGHPAGINITMCSTNYITSVRYLNILCSCPISIETSIKEKPISS